MSKAEDYIEDSIMNISNEVLNLDMNSNKIIYQPWLTPIQARKAVEIAREEELEYVKYQLELRLPETLDYNGLKVNRKDFINDFTKAMKDE